MGVNSSLNRRPLFSLPFGAGEIIGFVGQAPYFLAALAVVLYFGEMMIRWSDTKRDPNDEKRPPT